MLFDSQAEAYGNAIAWALHHRRLCGFTLNFMTLLGLSLAIGVLIDDAIVVRENIVRHMENGSDRRTAP